MQISKLIDTKYNIEIKGIKTNSKDVIKNDLFICALGLIDKNKYINEAIRAGASFVITNQDIQNDIPYIKVDNPNDILYDILNKFYNYPLRNTSLIGVTGTDGKTTIASIIHDLLSCPAIGSNGYLYNNQVIELSNTTPSLDKLFELFSLHKTKEIVMEVSSESYLTKRIPNLPFKVGIYTNITNEHLDKHKTFENYFQCKMQLLKNSEICVINHDDIYFDEIIKYNPNYLTYGKKDSDITIVDYQLEHSKTKVKFKYKGILYEVISPLIGEFNVYNLMASILTLIALNYDINDIIKRLELTNQPLGRLEEIYHNKFRIIIDYAHTTNSTLKVIKEIKKQSLSKLIIVVGCAGGRYKDKRSEIGEIVLEYADIAILTMDDPRLESVDSIINDMLLTTKKTNYLRINNREEAIKKAIDLASDNDIVLVLGKGRDKYMAIGKEYIPFSDVDVIDKYLN